MAHVGVESGRCKAQQPGGTDMKPTIQCAAFGQITVADVVHERDVVIRPSGKVKKRKNKLSKKEGGDSHVISLEEAKHIFGKGAARLIIGAGYEGRVRLSPEAELYFQEEDCSVELLPTPQAVDAWNKCQGKAIGMFHVNC
jgi:hypothetical protein